MSLQTELDKGKIIEIVKRCKKDPIFFIENFIIPADLGKPLKLYDKQKELIRSILKDHNVIVNSSRQVGKTTSVAAFMVWLLLFHKDYRIGVVSKDGKHATDIILDVYLMLQNLPPLFKPKRFIRDRTHDKMLDNGSRITAYAIPKSAPENVGRGIRVGFLFMDEVAFIPYVEEVFSAALPATLRIQQIYKERGYPYGTVLTSTPNGTEGVGRFFYEMWMKAIKGENSFKPITIHYTDVPNLNLEEFLSRKKDMPIEKWEQEYELKFLPGSSSFLDVDTALKIQENLDKLEPLKELTFKDNSLEFKVRLYDEISKEKTYLIGVDTASGEGGNSRQALVIYDYNDDKVVGEGFGKISLSNFAKMLGKITEQLFEENFLLLIERNYHGESVINLLKETAPNLINFVYKSYKDGKPKSNLQAEYKLGIPTTSKNRPLYFDALYSWLVERRDILEEKLPAPELRKEILGLEYVKGKVQAGVGSTDDLVMAFSIILYTLTHKRKELLKQIKRVEFNNKEEEVLEVLDLFKQRYDLNVPSMSSDF